MCMLAHKLEVMPLFHTHIGLISHTHALKLLICAVRDRTVVFMTFINYEWQNSHMNKTKFKGRKDLENFSI